MSLNVCRDSKPISSPGTVYESKTVRVFGGDEQDRYRAFNPVLATFCILNETGAKAASLINGKNTVQAIADQLSRDYQVDSRTVLPAIISLMEDLKKHKLIYCKGELAPAILETTSVASPEEVWLNVTNKCNLRCKTCFKNAGVEQPEEMSFEKICQVIDEVVDINGKRLVVSGGEPFARDDILDILAYIKRYDMSILLITNGTLIDEQKAKRLGEIKPNIIQVSLDGSKPEINDRIRGKGSYEKTLRAARMLLEQELDVRLYPTITKWNIHDLPDMKKLVLELRPGFDHLSCAKFVALGRGSEHEQELELSPKEFYEEFIRMPIGTYSTPEIIKKLKVAQETYDLTSFVPNRIPYGCRKVNCGLGSGTFSIDSDGKVYPCQWLHLPEYQAGNLHEQSLQEIYYGSELFAKMRGLRVDTDIPTCTSCEFKYFCGGACRARALMKQDDLYGEDPDCYYIKKFFEKGFWAENHYHLEKEQLAVLEEEYRQAQQQG